MVLIAGIQHLRDGIEPQFVIGTDIRGATRYERRHPIADLIRGLYGWSEEQADDFWRVASLL